MNPVELERLHAFVDDELDLQQRLAFEARLRDDAALRQAVDDLLALRARVRADASVHRMPSSLRARFAATASDIEARPRRVRVRSAWKLWLPAFALVMCAAVGVDLAWHGQQTRMRIGDEVLASHVRATLGQRLVDVSSADHHSVKPWLSARLDFSPPVGELGLPGCVFLGGRIDYVDGRPVAALVYRKGEHVVTTFVWPSPASRSAPGFDAERGYRLAHWNDEGMAHWVVSDLERDEFDEFVRAVQKQPE